MRTVCPRRGIRLPVGAWAAGLVGLCLSASSSGAQQAASDSARAAVNLAGTVVDVRTGLRLAGATVSLFDPSGMRVALVESGPSGAFQMGPLRPGLYAMHVQLLGYVDVRDDLRVDGGTPVLLTASLSPEAVPLDPVEVTVERQRTVAMREFDRRREMGIGAFVTREEIDARRPHRVTDVLRSMPGVRIVNNRVGDGHVLLRGQCRPNVYIDGVATEAGVSLDFSLQPDHIEGIEVYTTDSAPVQYSRNACGVILVWTRVPERVAGRGSWWKPLAVVGGLFATLIVIR